MTFLPKKSDQWGDNQLTDGCLSISYSALPACFSRFEQVFTLNALTTTHCIALEVENTLPSALTLLYLLEHGYNFLLLPKDALKNKNILPVFCRYTLRACCLDENSPDSLEPAHFLQIEESSAWQPEAWDGQRKLLLRTSGSTGIPKMAVHSHANLQGNIRHCVERFALTATDRVAIPAPLYHMYGLGAAFLPSILAGASIDLQKGANLLKFIQREQQFIPNVAFMTPAFCNTLLKVRKSKRFYRLTVTAGDRFRANQFAHYEQAFGCLVQLYGSTELGAIAAGQSGLPLTIRARSAGLPMPDVQLKVDRVAGKQEGALWCKRKYGFSGYVDTQGNTINLGSEFVDGWFHTKDIAKIDSQGYVEILGRSDHSVNRDGLLVFFADLEKTMETLEAVEAVAVVAGEEGVRGKQLIAYCVVNKNTPLSVDEIRAYCFDKLPQRAVPDVIHLLDDLPLLPNGKIDRMTLVKKLNIL
jgi:acyl-CoA synthetase (AMP-forming)/AMP-acid ligase II